MPSKDYCTTLWNTLSRLMLLCDAWNVDFFYNSVHVYPCTSICVYKCMCVCMCLWLVVQKTCVPVHLVTHTHTLKPVYILSILYHFIITSITSKNKRSDRWDETSKERIEGERANKTAVAELDYSSKQNVKQICINNFQFLWRRLHVLIVESDNNGSQALWHLDCWQRLRYISKPDLLWP